MSPTLREQILIESNRTLDLVAQAVADGIALRHFRPRGCPTGGKCAVGSAQRRPGLAAHPIRRTLVAADAVSLYHASWRCI